VCDSKNPYNHYGTSFEVTRAGPGP